MGNSLTVMDWTEQLIPAQGELTDSEILDRYGVLMGDAVSAFRQDPSYVVEMAESAATLRSKREQRAASRKAA